MNEETTETQIDSPAPAVTHAQVPLAYAGASRMVAGDDQAQLALFGNLKREPV